LPRIYVNPGPGKYNFEHTFNTEGKFKDSRNLDLKSYKFDRSIRTCTVDDNKIPGPGR